MSELKKKILDKSATLGVCGLGYVGLPLAVEKAKAGYHVLGFDVQEIRIGGIITRVDSCKKRILAYCKGEISEISELEEELLPLRNDESLALVGDYDMIATPSTLWGVQ